MLSQLSGFLQVQFAQDLGGDDAHQSIGLDQQLAVVGKALEGLLPLQFGVGPHRCGPQGHQFVSPFHQAGAAGGGVALFEHLQLAHHRVQEGVPVVEQVPQPGAFGRQVFGFLAQAFLFQTGEAPQGHGQNGLGLAFRQVELHLQGRFGGCRIGGGGDHGNHLLQVGQGFDQTLNHLQAIFTAPQGVAGAAQQGEFAVFEKMVQQLAQAELLGLAVHQGQQDGTEIALQGRAPLQIFQHLGGFSITAHFHHHPHAVPIALIANIGDAGDLAVVDLFGQLFDPAGLAELIGQFRDHHGTAAMATLAGLNFLEVGHTAHRDAAAATQIGFAYTTAD